MPDHLPSDATAVADLHQRAAPAHLKPYQFQPGQPKRGGRRKLTPNKDRTVTTNRIVKLADPIGALCDIANGKPMKAGLEPGAKEAVLVYPTVADRLQALKTLAAKIMPDLKAVSVEDGGQLVSVVLQLGQKVTVTAGEAPGS
jgi:hypothetical protein